MDTTELSKLAELLRKNGADVFSGASKFTLSLDLLCDLNNSFSLIVDQRDVMNSSFHVINSSTEKLDVFRDMHFLHDFIQRSASLKLTPPYSRRHGSSKGDISKFKNLKLLEVHNLDLDHIVGIECVRSRLQQLICTRSLKNMKSVLQTCGGDDCELENIKWDDLKEAVFSHNHLESIDSMHLLLMPNLHTLDLSHNDLEDVDVLNVLSNLKNLNLSYNKLIKVPEFTGPLCNRIQILVLCYNFIEDLGSIANLSNLRELDLSGNCIVAQNALVPLAHLATLQMLNLSANPMSYNPQHRCRSACYLHDNTSTVRFLLDGKLLSKAEKHFVGSLHPRIRVRTSSNQSTNHQPTVEKPRRIRNVTITDNEYTPIIENDSDASMSSLITSGDHHLDAKRQIEELKSQYGNDWLKSQAGSLVQNVLGIEQLVVSSTPYGSADCPIQIVTEQEIDTHEPEDQSTQPYVTASDSIHADADTNGVYDVSDTHSNPPSEVEDDDDDDELGDGEESIFLATVKDQDDQVFIVITQSHVLERECTSTKEKSRWPIDTLTTCEHDEASITVHFDTLKNDAKSRTYEWDDKESPKLLQAFKTIIANQPEAAATLNVYKCLKCCTQFGVEITKTLYDENINECPTCGSDLVFEDDS